MDATKPLRAASVKNFLFGTFTKTLHCRQERIAACNWLSR